MKTLIVGLILLVVGIIVAAVGGGGLAGSATSMMQTKDFVAPGSMQLEVETPGPVALMYIYQTTFDGKSYQTEADIPDDIAVTITGPGGESIPFSMGTVDDNIEINQVAMTTVGNFETVASGTHTIDVQFTGEERVFGTTGDLSAALGGMAAGFGGMCVGVVLAGLGFIVAIIGLIMKLTGGKKQQPA